MNLFMLVIVVPALAGLVGWVVSRLRNELTFIGAILTLYFAVRLFINALSGEVSYRLLEVSGQWVWFRLDQLSSFILLFVAVFGVLVMLFSFRYMRNWQRNRSYYLYVMLLLAGANGVLLAGNLLTLLFFWGSLLVVTYGTLLIGRPGAEEAAGKALVLLGSSDFALLLGIVMLLARTGGTDFVSGPLALSDGWLIASYLLIAAGALAKAGSMPFHSWIPTAARTAPATVMAFLPGVLDKSLGIYLLTRLSFGLFDIAGNPAVRNVLMTVGAVTIVAAGIAALIQRRVMKTLAFSTVSQVGYIVIGIGTGLPIAVAGALFHMLNNVLFKAGLFLSAGTVEFWTRDDDYDKLGGLARQMPLTFFSFLLCALALAGVPPLSGFFSKWMIYQGIIELGGQGSRIYPLFLVAAMLGSVLTLAYVLKMIHGIFLGQRPREIAHVREGSFTMWLPTLLIALTCVGFGVFAFSLPLARFILPALPGRLAGALGQPGGWLGVWRPELATILMIISLGVGAVIYLLGTARKPVRGRTFVGGEKIADDEESRVPGTAFYSAVKELPLIGEGLRFGEGGALDLHNWLKGLLGGLGAALRSAVDETLDRAFGLVGRFVLAVGAGVSKLMTGQLPLYVSWMFLGAALLYLVLLLR